LDGQASDLSKPWVKSSVKHTSCQLRSDNPGNRDFRHESSDVRFLYHISGPSIVRMSILRRQCDRSIIDNTEQHRSDDVHHVIGGPASRLRRGKRFSVANGFQKPLHLGLLEIQVVHRIPFEKVRAGLLLEEQNGRSVQSPWEVNVLDTTSDPARPVWSCDWDLPILPLAVI